VDRTDLPLLRYHPFVYVDHQLVATVLYQLLLDHTQEVLVQVDVVLQVVPHLRINRVEAIAAWTHLSLEHSTLP
jgi:hypothetical protein